MQQLQEFTSIFLVSNILSPYVWEKNASVCITLNRRQLGGQLGHKFHSHHGQATFQVRLASAAYYHQFQLRHIQVQLTLSEM